MEKKTKSLQKFTKIELKIDNLLSLEKITTEDLKPFSDSDLKKFSIVVTEKVNSLKGIEKDEFLKKIESITPKLTKNELWESNHNNITWAISVLIQEYGRLPSKNEIARKTDLSRQTIHKHLKDYASHPLFREQIEQFHFMASKVLARVYEFAINGDVRAAKLYFNLIGNQNNGLAANGTLIQNQNNYIQINGMILSQDIIKHLEPEQLTTIEAILKTVHENQKLVNEEN